MENNLIVFDEVICSSILFHVPPQEWGIVKPFLISQTFRTVCDSEEFAKQYLVNLFKLSSEQVEQLKEACSLLKEKDRDDLHKPKRKKRKLSLENLFNNHDGDDGRNDELIMHVKKSMKQVLWTYFHMSFVYDSETIKKDMIDVLGKHRKGAFTETNVLDQVQDDLKYLQLENYLLKSFNYFTSEEPQRIMTKSKDFVISEKVLLKIFGNIKDLFLVDIEEVRSATIINICLFTSFGYPLFLRSEYVNMSTGHGMKEKLDVYGQHVFLHQLNKGDAIDKFDMTKLETLQKLLFHKNVDNILMEDGIGQKVLSDVKLSLLYEFLQCCFGSNGTMFRRMSLGWVPFVGRVRGVVREVGSTDFGSSSEDDDDDDEEEEEDEEVENFQYEDDEEEDMDDAQDED